MRMQTIRALAAVIRNDNLAKKMGIAPEIMTVVGRDAYGNPVSETVEVYPRVRGKRSHTG